MISLQYLLTALAFMLLAALFIYIGLNNPIVIAGREFARSRIVRVLSLLLAGIFLGIALRIIWLIPRI